MSMDDFEGSYAPQSPDLSEYQSFDQPQADPFSTTQSSYQTSSQQPVPQPQNSHPDFYPQDQFPSQPPPNPLTYDPFGPDPSSFPGRQQYPPPSQVQYQPNLPTMPKHSRSQFDQSQQDWLPPNQQPAAKPGRKSKKAKVEEEVCEKPAPGVEEGIEVKTKFPVARIKRIMQADEDVGKVSQVTPTAVCEFPPPPFLPLPLIRFSSFLVCYGKEMRRSEARLIQTLEQRKRSNSSSSPSP